MKKTKRIASIIVLVFAGQIGQAETLGPVADACKAEIKKFCADKEHGYGEVRRCLESQKDKLSKQCRQILETTGKGMGKKKNW